MGFWVARTAVIKPAGVPPGSTRDPSRQLSVVVPMLHRAGEERRVVRADDLVAMVDGLTPAGPSQRPMRHQAILLLWAIGRARRNLPRLERWADAQEQLRPLFITLGRPGSRPTPEYPFVALAGSGWWELPDAGDEIPRAHGSAPLKWLRAHNPQGGLPAEVYSRLASDAAARAAVVQALLGRFFHDDSAAQALAMTGLDDIAFGTVDARSVRDPAWAWDELVLACDLVAGNGWHELPSEHPLVVELSGLLRSLPIHPAAARGARFRSRDSVRRKMADLATRHPDSARQPTNGGKLDLEVLNAFLERPQEMHATAMLLRSGADTGEFDDLPDADDTVIDDYGAREGRLLERLHLRREREPRLRKRKIDKVLKDRGLLECEVCGFEFQRIYGARGAGYAECHHTSGDTTTRLEDLALLCANCHRMIHRGTTWLTPTELRDLVRSTAAAVMALQ